MIKALGRVMLLLALSLVLSGCFECGEPLGISAVGAEMDRLVAFKVYDDVLDGPFATVYESTDLGETWQFVEHLSSSDPWDSYSRQSSWCSAEACYQIEGLTLSSTADGTETVLWEPPPGRAEFVELGSWGRTGEDCGAPQDGPMALNDIDGASVAGVDVILVAAGRDGVLLQRGGEEILRVGIAEYLPRPFRSFGNGLNSEELLPPLGLGAAVLLFAAALITIRFPATAPATSSWKALGRVVGFLVGFLAVLIAVLTSLWYTGAWIPLTIGVWAVAVYIWLLRRGSPSHGAFRYLTLGWFLPSLLGWLPLAGWSIALPAFRSTAVAWSWVLSVAGAAIAVVVLWKRVPEIPSEPQDVRTREAGLLGPLQ